MYIIKFRKVLELFRQSQSSYIVRTEQLWYTVCRVVADIYGWPESRCKFPKWFSATHWTEVTQNSTLYVTSGGDVMLLDQRQPPPTLTNHTTTQVCTVSDPNFVSVPDSIRRSKHRFWPISDFHNMLNGFLFLVSRSI